MLKKKKKRQAALCRWLGQTVTQQRAHTAATAPLHLPVVRMLLYVVRESTRKVLKADNAVSEASDWVPGGLGPGQGREGGSSWRERQRRSDQD